MQVHGKPIPVPKVARDDPAFEKHVDELLAKVGGHTVVCDSSSAVQRRRCKSSGSLGWMGGGWPHACMGGGVLGFFFSPRTHAPSSESVSPQPFAQAVKGMQDLYERHRAEYG